MQPLRSALKVNRNFGVTLPVGITVSIMNCVIKCL
nr:MAG TPA: hypothetical protein [Crassvirales sp.]